MANETYNVDDTFGLSPAVGAYVHESRRGSTVKRFEVTDEEGEIVDHRAGAYREMDVQISGQGDANFAAVTVGDFSEGSVKAIEAEGSETNDGEYRTFEMVGKGYENLDDGGGDGDGGGGGGGGSE